jgi:bacteriocin-like protein
VKTLIDQKNLMPQVAGLVNGTTTTGELPAPELAELSEEDLQQIVGGRRYMYQIVSAAGDIMTYSEDCEVLEDDVGGCGGGTHRTVIVDLE